MENPIQSDFIRWIVFLPLLGAIVNGLLGAKIQKSLGKQAISFIACAPVVIAFGLSLYALLVLKGLEPEKRFLIDNLYRWVDLGSLKVDMAFMVDPLSAVMILVVTGIGGLIHIYATGYMHEDKAFWRFFAFLNPFTAAMLTLVTGDNLLLMFVGWEGVDLCSYALIGFWYQDHNNARAGNKAFIVNRVGDFGFVLGIFLLFWTLDAQGHGTLVFREIAKWASTLQGQMIWGVPVVTLATLFLFVGATGKSAQSPRYVWLPDARAGPTPVSALIHAATMVTAGVFLVARTHALFEASGTAQTVVVVVGALTALLAALIAIGQDDLKKILAYSTVSQLGYMFIGVGLGPIGYAAGMFHLVTHAFFKAQLFLGAGSVMHGNDDDVDIKHFGGLRAAMPVTFWTTVAAWAAIIGVPFTAGFYSKDQVLAAAFDHGGIGRLAWVVGVLTAGLTAFYMTRYLFLTFLGERRWPEGRHPHESPPIMTVPLLVLGALAVGAGFWRSADRPRGYLALLLVLETAMLGVFVSLDLFLFYVFWEAVLVPAYFLIGSFGGQRRVYAAVKFFVYTLLGGLLMLVGIVVLFYLQQRASGSPSFDFEVLRDLDKDPGTQRWLFAAFFAAFAVKTPLWPFHTWLPDAYTEAPTTTTVLLAGVMSKLGVYGFLRFCLGLFPDAARDLQPLLLTLAVVGIVYCALVAAVQRDFKTLVAYSSVSHLGFIVLGVFALNLQGLQGAVFYMVAHGLLIGGLFFVPRMLQGRRGPPPA